jgi:hypothetical protein
MANEVVNASLLGAVAGIEAGARGVELLRREAEDLAPSRTAEPPR